MARKYRRKAPGPARGGAWRELWGVALILAAALGFVSLLTGSAGVVGEFVAYWLYLAFGRGALVFPALVLAAGGYLAVTGKPVAVTPRLFGLALAFVVLLLILHLPAPPGTELLPEVRPYYGGWVGGALSRALVVAFGTGGRGVVVVGLAFVAALAVTGLSPGRAVGLIIAGLRWLFRLVVRQTGELAAGARGLAGNRAGGGQASFREAGDGRLVRAERDPAPTPPEDDTGSATDPVAVTAAGAAPARPLPDHPAGPPTPPETSPEPAPVTPSVAVADPGGAMPQIRPYRLPALDILRKPPKARPGRAAQDAESRAALLEETFASFNVGIKVMEINPGPTVTRFEVRPAPGVKVSKIESLADDIALSLAAADVRIAPIPGKGLIGVEVPNTEVSLVYLREVLESTEFQRAESRLTFGVGKDIAGQVILADLERMLHLLIAGATGSGKSVCLNALIASILFKASPSEVRLLMIDPKVVEFQVFDGIPHLLSPVINDPKKASQILRWAVKEMLDRYARFSEVGVRNIGDYNRRMEAADSSEAASPEPAVGGPVSAAAADGFPLPRIVILIDELADLMMVSPVEVEDSIWRLAQMARAAGIHLVVATQRPSVNVITGVIKANIPSRIAFAVASQVDSRTILDMAGAEKLLGRGDMLFYPVGGAKPRRAQGALITDREIEDLVRYVKRQADPSYMESFPVPEDSGPGETQEFDDKWADALRVVFNDGQASTSMLQRRLRVGYTRAARMVDMMEELGIVAKSDGVKPRDVLMSIEQYTERYGPLAGDSPEG